MMAPATRSDQVDPPGGQVADGHVGAEAAGRVHGGALVGAAHGAPGQDVGADRKGDERPVEFGPVGQVEEIKISPKVMMASKAAACPGRRGPREPLAWSLAFACVWLKPPGKH